MFIIDAILDWWYRYVVPNGYTSFEMILFFTGLISWVYAYYHIIQQARRYAFCDMPTIIAPANFAWEILWSFYFIGDFGAPFQWGCRIWFAMDIIINYFAFRYGHKTIPNVAAKKQVPALWLISFFGWLFIVYFLAEDGTDNRLGVQSALMINVVMSALYINNLLNFPEYRGKGMSLMVAIGKMLGTGVISVASIIHWEKNGFLITLGLMSLILDVIYVYLFLHYQPEIVHEEA